MTKARSLQKKSKQHKMGVKDGLVVKKKAQAFKNTPTGKVPLVKSKKNEQNGKKANGAQAAKNKKQFGKKQKPEIKPKESEDEDELDSDDESMEHSDESTDDTPENKGVKMFKGLKNDSDQDEDDDDDDDDDDLDSDDSLNDEDDDDDDDDDDEEDDDDDDDDEAGEELDDSKPDLKALLGDSLADDDDDDDFNEDDDESDDDMSDDEDATLDSSNPAEIDAEDDDDDEDDDEEDDDEDDEDEDEDKSALGLKALLGDSLVDEDDDDDFEGEEEDDEDDDISEESDEEDEKDDSINESKSKGKEPKEKEEKVKLSQEEQEDIDSRTIFVGNVPKDTSRSAIKKLFRKFGEIENVRIRGVIPEDGRISKKVATITKKMHPKVTTVHSYVVFKSKDSPQQALSLNGHKLGENHLRVDLTKSKSPQKDEKKAVFLGNLPFEVSEEEVRSHFASCGKIHSVRIVKDKFTGVSRGIGYINFDEEDSVALALELNNTKVKGREVRVNPYSSPSAKSKKQRKRHFGRKDAQKNPQKKFKNVQGKPVTVQNEKGQKQKRSQGVAKREKPANSESPKTSPVKKEKSSFQGKKADAKKKPKAKKLDKQQKILAQKLTSVKKSSKTTD